VKLSTAQGRREAERQRRIRRLRRRRALRLTAAGAVALGLVAAIGLSLGGRAAQQSGLGGWASAVRNFARAQLAAARVDALRIDIKFKHLHRIHTKRDEALARGVLIAERSDFVPASIALAGPAVPVRLRLIGPEPEHLQRDPWSFEVRVRGDAHIEGMRRFALHAPDLVGGALPLVAALQLERAGLAAPRTSLVEVSLNGDGLGLAVLVELPSAELLRSHGYGAAPVVQLDTRDYWKALGDNARAGPFDNPFTARIIADPEGDEDATATAIGLLRGFLDGALSASEVFDLDATARWLASAELWGDPSCVHWSRARFFLDPLSARLAPIPPLPERRRPLEQDPSEPRGELVAALGELGARLLADSELRHRFARELRALSDQLGSGTGLGGLVAALETRQQQVLLRLHRSAPFSRVVRLAERADRLASLRDIDASRDTWFAPSLARGELSLPSVVAAYAREDEQGAYLDLHNLLPVPVTVSTLRHDDGDGDEATPVTLASRVTFPIQLEPTPLGQPARAVRVRYRQPNVAAVPEAIRGIARIAGDRREYEFLAASSPPPLLTHPIPTATLDEVLAQHPFLRSEPGDLALHTQPGVFEVEGSLVMPPAMGLVIEAGTQLAFGARAALIASGPLDLRGTPEEPVVLRGAPGRRGPRWLGLALLRAQRPSSWSHVEIRDTTGVERDGWQLPGGVTIRSATVQMDGVRIAGSRADAALAAVNAEIDAEGLTIEQSAGTALVLRGSRGRLRGLAIAETGGGGLAATSSTVQLIGGSLRDIRATALEAADGSELEAEGVEIAGASVAAASKNGARLILRDAQIRGIAHVPFLAFTDRLELGGGQILASGNDLEPGERIAIAQRGSSAIIDGIASEPVEAAIGGLRIE
jgi:hypothetical protein